jgi:HptB-dependent secretion and biofilm anti anti-sigma factor
MDFVRFSEPNNEVIALSGRFTFSDYQRFSDLIAEMRASEKNTYVLDLAGVDFLDSAAIGMLLVLREEARRQGWNIILRHPTGPARKTLQRSALDTVFGIEA